MKRRFLNLPRYQKQILAAAFDFFCLPLIFLVSLLLDNGSSTPPASQMQFAMVSGILSIPLFIRLGLYRAVIRYIDHQIIVTVLTGVAQSVAAMAIAYAAVFTTVPSPTLFCIYGLNTILYLLASRFAARGYFLGERRARLRAQPVLIYGAGTAGNALASALMAAGEYFPVGFVDDNPQVQDTTIAGIKVYGPDAMPRLLAKHGIKTVLLAIPSLSRRRQRELVDALTELRVKLKVTPSINNLVRGHARVDDVRQIEIEDLLSRDQVQPNGELLATAIHGKSILVSGAGGSIGSELCRQIVTHLPARLVLLESSEYGLYAVEQELNELCEAAGHAVEIIPCLGSVLDRPRCEQIMRAFGVSSVYHAAAYKHVPLVEYNPIQGLRNNVFGTLELARAAQACNVASFVLVSTDKAVRPTNVMGASKRLAELILQAFARQAGPTRFSMVRFGNVLGSSGSVVPLFRKQIAAGGPVTLTHPEITRYFMTIPEAAQLVIQAGALAEGGDVFVLDMGEPVKIADLARKMIHLSGMEVADTATPNGIEIRYVGLRPGEKLYEELLIGDNVFGTEHPLIMRAREGEIAWPFLEKMLKQLAEACDRGEHDAIRAHLGKMVSEYQPSSSIADITWTERHVSVQQV